MRPSSLSILAASLALPLVAACGGTGTTSIPPGGSSGSSGSGGSGGSGASAGPQVSIRIAAEQSPLSITAGVSHQTPIDQRVGVLGLQLLRSEDDPSPLVVLAKSSPVDTGYNAGDNTLIGSVTASSLTAGTYVFARIPVAYVTFTVAGTYHESGLGVAGAFSDSISLAAQTLLDGATRDQGWWSSTFMVGNTNEGSTSGEGAEFAQPGPGSGIRLDMSGPTGAYVFPVSITVDPTVDHDVTYLFSCNTYEDFRWQDEHLQGYEKGVFDVSYGAFETVTQLGANSISLTLE